MNGEGGNGKQSAYQWVDDRTAFCMTLQTAFGGGVYIFYHLYDRNGITVLRRRSMRHTMRVKADFRQVGPMLSAGIFIEGRYSGMILLVNTETEREWRAGLTARRFQRWPVSLPGHQEHILAD